MRFDIGIFGLNGTLLDDVEISRECAKRVFQYFTPNFPVQKLADYRSDHAIVEIANIYNKLNLPIGAEEIYPIWEEHYDKLSPRLTLNDGARMMLLSCKAIGMRTALITKAHPKIQRYLRRLTISEDMFDKMHFRAIDKEGAINDTLNKFDIPTYRAFYMTDSQDGIHQGNKTNVYTAAYTGGYHSEEVLKTAKPCCVVKSFHEALNILVIPASRTRSRPES